MTEAAGLEIELMGADSERYPTSIFITRPNADDDIRARVCELLMAHQQPGYWQERRRDKRYDYPHLVRLSAVAGDGRSPYGPAIVVAAKTLSEGGFGFYHPEPISARRMHASFHAGDGRWVGFIIDLPWCRFTAAGWYESGARFLEAVPGVRPELNKIDTPSALLGEGRGEGDRGVK
jgi:hypothetical protein